MSEDIIVEILRYGRSKKPGREMGFTRDELKSHLKSLGFKMDYEDDQTTNIIFDSCFTCNVPAKGQYVMRADAYFTLLEYEELEEARASSKQANIWAIVALSVSIIGTILSIIFSIQQINSPTEVNQSQIDEVVKAINFQTRRVDSLIEISKRKCHNDSETESVQHKQDK